MKAVIYARYSSDNQREESIEGQIRECTAFAEKNGITILRHYIDRAFSAKTDNRPEFQNMIKDSGKRLFDMIIVWKLDRFARNRYDSARYKATLKKNGVKVVSATEVISDGAEGIILESVLEGYAEYYSADLSEKVVRGMTENALKSKYNGGTLPIGYQIDSDQCFQLDPLTAPFVREAFQRYDEGATMTQIRDWLNEQGVKNTRGQKMTYNSIQHLLNNRRYIGEYTYRDIVVPDGIPAIVPQDLFDRVHEKLAKNKKAPARHKAEDDYLLTTKLFCGYCGAYLCGESGTSHTGNVHHYYKCVSVKKKRTECHKKSVRKEWIEDLVVSETMKMVMDDTAIEAIVSMLMDLQDRENVNLPLYEQQLREADTAIQNLLNAIQQGILTKSTKGRLEELEATKEELETKIACEKLAKPKVSAEFMTFWLHRFRKLDVRQKSHRKMLIDTFINAIFLYDDKMVITFNYKDGTDTITFDDLKIALADQKTGSDLDCSTAPRRNGLRSIQKARLVSRAFFIPLRHSISAQEPPLTRRLASKRACGRSPSPRGILPMQTSAGAPAARRAANTQAVHRLRRLIISHRRARSAAAPSPHKILLRKLPRGTSPSEARWQAPQWNIGIISAITSATAAFIFFFLQIFRFHLVQFFFFVFFRLNTPDPPHDDQRNSAADSRGQVVCSALHGTVGNEQSGQTTRKDGPQQCAFAQAEIVLNRQQRGGDKQNNGGSHDRFLPPSHIPGFHTFQFLPLHFSALLAPVRPLAKKQEVQNDKGKNVPQLQRDGAAGEHPDGHAQDQAGNDAAPQRAFQSCAQKILGHHHGQRDGKACDELQNHCSVHIQVPLMTRLLLLFLLLVLVDDEFCRFQVDAGIHRQPLDEGGKGLLLFLVCQFYLLDELVQPQPHRGVRHLIKARYLFQRAGLEHKVFQKRHILRLQRQEPLRDFVYLQFNSPFMFALTIFNIT